MKKYKLIITYKNVFGTETNVFYFRYKICAKIYGKINKFLFFSDYYIIDLTI